MIINIWLVYGVIDFYPSVSSSKLAFLDRVCGTLCTGEVCLEDNKAFLQCLFGNGLEVRSLPY